MYIYIAGPLCSEAEREFNEKLNTFLKARGMLTYLPQAHGGFLDEMVGRGLDED
jgi:nucleoside 2-deoxyribosyltransferase